MRCFPAQSHDSELVSARCGLDSSAGKLRGIKSYCSSSLIERPMHILFSGMEWFPECRDGGLDRYFHEQLRALADQGVTGTALISSARAVSMGVISIEPMAHKGASLLGRWSGARCLAAKALREGVNVVNAHFALYAFPWLRMIPASVPLVVNFQGPWAEEMRVQSSSLKRRLVSTVAKQIETAVYRRADRVITLSEAFRQLLHEQYGVPLSRIRVVPGALHLDRYLAASPRAEARQRLGWPADRTVLLSVRRLAKRMGLELLIDAVAEVRAEFPQVLLLIGGKGPEADRLQERIAERQLGENVRLLGFVPEEELPLAYAAADVSVVPTTALEGFGLITAESLACGTPVLGTPVGATPEILRPLDPNLVFEAPTVRAMAERIRQVLRGEIRLPDREACRSYVQRYGWPAVVPKILAVYEEAIAERRAKG